MRWGVRRPSGRQGLLPFAERAGRRDRAFRRGAVVLFAVAACGLIGGTPAGRYAARLAAFRVRSAGLRAVGGDTGRDETDAEVRVRRARTVERVRASLAAFYAGASGPVRRLFDVSGMDPAHVVIGSGRADDAFVLSSAVYAPDGTGRSFRLRPGVRSVWLREIVLRGAPMALLLVPDTPEVRRVAGEAGAIVVESSRQTTNSWGLRGPEPDVRAPYRVLVLGDSFMQGMFIGDDDAPPRRLQAALEAARGAPVSVLNTGHIGYAPEQYFRTLQEYGDRFKPHCVVVSVCPNDFGDGQAVVLGRGDDWDEAAYWIERVVVWCRGRGAAFLLAPAPQNGQVDSSRKNGSYPGHVSDVFAGGPVEYVDALDGFIDEFLALRVRANRGGGKHPAVPLYNREIGDSHFSPQGSEVWARVVARRVALLVDLHRDRPPGPATRAAAGGPGR